MQQLNGYRSTLLSGNWLCSSSENKTRFSNFIIHAATRYCSFNKIYQIWVSLVGARLS